MAFFVIVIIHDSNSITILVFLLLFQDINSIVANGQGGTLFLFLLEILFPIPLALLVFLILLQKLGRINIW